MAVVRSLTHERDRSRESVKHSTDNLEEPRLKIQVNARDTILLRKLFNPVSPLEGKVERDFGLRSWRSAHSRS